jgi:hypothetical protein
MSYYKSTWTNTVTRLNACVCRTRAPTPARPTLPTTAGHGPATCAPAAPAPGAHEDTQHAMEVPGARPQCARLAADAAGGAVAGGVSVVCAEALTQDASRPYARTPDPAYHRSSRRRHLRQAHMRIHSTRWKSLVLALSVHDWLLTLLAALLLGVFRWSARKP